MSTLTTRFKKLATSYKAIVVGSFFMGISAILPWYSDMDKFNTGDIFLGITGPVYLAGIIVLCAGFASCGIGFLRMQGKPLPKLPLKESHFHMFTGALSLLMSVLASSVYFHTKFGLNLTDKKMGIGLMLAFFASGIVMGAGILYNRRASALASQEEEIDALTLQQREPGTLSETATSEIVHEVSHTNDLRL